MGTRIHLINAALRRSLPLALAAAVIAAMCFAAAPRPAFAVTLTVNSTGDAGDISTGDGICDSGGGVCTLRAAIQEINALGGADTIVFDSATFKVDLPATINLGTLLPALSTGSDTISGVGAGVIVSGAALGASTDCLTIGGEGSDSNAIKGLEIRSCPGDGVDISDGADNNTVGGSNAPESGAQCTNSTDDDADGYVNDGCPVVTGSPEGPKCTGAVDDDGDTLVNDGCPAVGPAESGGQCTNSVDDDADSWVNDGCPVFSSTTEGAQCLNAADDDGDAAVNDGCLARGAGNVIWGNGNGVRIRDSATIGNTVAGNLIGTDFDGIYDQGNTTYGIVVIGSPSNTIGGTTAGERNVISGNDVNGVHVQGSTATSNIVRGSYIGTNAAGDAAIGNSARGVEIESANNTIGGTTVGARNVISGNGRGLAVEGSGLPAATGNVIQGNYFGVGADGATSVPNTLQGVYLANLDGGATVGGTVAGAGNVIANNGDQGIVALGPNNIIQGNTITGNGLVGPDDGIYLESAGNTIGGSVTNARNVISGNGRHGILITTAAATGNMVQGNHIGTNASGGSAAPNGTDGVFIGNGATGNTIGGTAPGERNVISGNGDDGVDINGAATTATVIGNYIGTDAAGSGDLGNTDNGVEIENSSDNNTIGGATAGHRNVVSGNGNSGIKIEHFASSGNTVAGNLVGLNAAGTTAIANAGSGVFVGGPSNTIGGSATTAGAPPGNVISGNNGDGIYFSPAAIPGNTVKGNLIGTNEAGSGGVPNLMNGVYVDTVASTVIGGTSSGEANVIAFNTLDGVLVSGGTATGNSIRANSIYANGTTASHLGIDLDPDGVTANDGSGDPDTGPNNLMNFPVIAASSISYDGVHTYISGTLDTSSPGDARVDVYATDVVDTSGNGEGRAYLGAATPDGSGAWTLTYSGTPPYNKITATATDTSGTGSTSEFSLAVTPSVGSRMDATAIASQGQTAPGTGGGTFDKFGPASVPNTGDPSTPTEVVFWAAVVGGSVSQGIFQSPPGGPITKLVAVGDSTPLGGTFSALGAVPVMNQTEEVVFWASVSGGSAAEGIFRRTSGGVVSKIVAKGDMSPVPPNTYDSFQPLAGRSTPVNNDDGDIAFWASLSGGGNGVFLYSAASSTVGKVAVNGDSAPGGGTFSTFVSPGGFATVPIVTDDQLSEDDQTVAFRAFTAGGPASGIYLASGPGPTLTRLAATGEATPLGGTYSGFGRAPSPNNSGEVAFFASISGGSAATCTSVAAPCAVFFRDSSGVIEKVIAAGDSGPSGVSGSISDLNAGPFMNDSGQVVAWTGISNGFSTQSLVRYTPGEGLENVAAVGNTMPTIGGTFADFIDPSGFPTNPVPNNLGQVAYWGEGSEGIFLTTLPTGPVITQGPVAGATAPGTGGGTFGTTFDLDIDDNGQAVFANTITGSATGVDSGIFVFFAGDPVQDVAVANQSAPGGGTFDNFYAPFSNDIGTIAAHATTTGGPGDGLYIFFAGIFFAGDPPAPYYAAYTGQAANGGSTFSTFGDPSINNSNEVAVQSTLASGQGVYVFFAGSPSSGGNPVSHVKLAKNGDSDGAGRTFSTFGRPVINDRRDVAVNATLNTGEGIYVFFAGSPTPTKIVRTGDSADANGRTYQALGDPAINFNQAVTFTATYTPPSESPRQGLFVFFAGSPAPTLLADITTTAPVGSFTDFFSPVMTDGTEPVVVARATISGVSGVDEGLFVFFAGAPGVADVIVAEGDDITDTTDPDDEFGCCPPNGPQVFPYHAINNGSKVVFIGNVKNAGTTQGVYFAALDSEPSPDGVLDFLDNCPLVFNTDQHDFDGDNYGNACDNCVSVSNAGQANGDSDTLGDACDNCPSVTNQDQANFDADTRGDVCDPDDDNDLVSDVDESFCGGANFNASLRPERLDTPGDDDGDTVANESLPGGSAAYDCDGDGWRGDQENLIYGDAPSTARDQDPCGNNGWPAELSGGNNVLNIADIGSFLTPARAAADYGSGGAFNMFDHALDDDGDTMIESAEDPGSPGGPTYNVRRWNLLTPPHTASTKVNIGDLNSLITGAEGSPARPPMFGGQLAFFTNGGVCPFAP
jgi:CSLREA domain-containing protein